MPNLTPKRCLVDLMRATADQSPYMAAIRWKTDQSPKGSPYYGGPHVPAPLPYVTYTMSPSTKENRLSGPYDEAYTVEISIVAERDDDVVKVEQLADPLIEGSLFNLLDRIDEPRHWISGPGFEAYLFDRTTPYDLQEDEIPGPQAKRVWIAKASYDLAYTQKLG